MICVNTYNILIQYYKLVGIRQVFTLIKYFDQVMINAIHLFDFTDI